MTMKTAAVSPHSMFSARQRLIVLTFDTVEDAERWDQQHDHGDDVVAELVHPITTRSTRP